MNKRLKYLLEKEKVCPLDKQELWELTELLSGEAPNEREETKK